MNNTEPTNCDTCKASLDRGYSYKYENNVLVSALCFECSSDRDLKEYQDTKILRTRFVTDNSLALYNIPSLKDFVWVWNNIDSCIEGMNNALPPLKGPLRSRVEAHISFLKIFRKIKLFESEVWFAGLKQTVNASTVKGVSAKTGDKDDFCVLTYCMCGRCMITIEDKTSSVTLITDEKDNSPVMGERGFCGTEEQIMSLIDKSIDLYKSGSLKFIDDEKVGMGF